MIARRLGVAALCAAALVAGCGDDEEQGAGTGAAAPEQPAAEAVAEATVEIADFKFGPAQVTIEQGGSVTWTNRDSAPHNAENKQLDDAPEMFATATPIEQGKSDTVTFDTPGTYMYYCVYHRFMEAEVTVNERGGS